MILDQLLALMAEKKASDLFLAPGSPITIKLNGVCVPINQDRLTPQGVVELLAQRLSNAHFRELEESCELNVGIPAQGLGKFRLSAFRQRGTIAAVLRFIPSDIPQVDVLHLPPAFKELALSRRGLALVVGAAGSGKSTSIAAMIDYRNELQTGHIITFEDPIEFLFRNKKSIINQREIGADARSLQAAMRNAMRQAPDVLFIGEIRDRDTMSAALAYAMSGHFVIATMHATNCPNALNRIISFYSPETRAALFEDIATALRAIVCQRLVRSRQGGRVPAVEMLINNGHTRDLIVRGDVSGVKELLTRSLAPENRCFEQSLYELLREDRITRDDALAAADSQNNLLWFINNAGRAQPPAEPTTAEDEAPAISFAEITLNI